MLEMGILGLGFGARLVKDFEFGIENTKMANGKWQLLGLGH
jgi:hypothetical protein